MVVVEARVKEGERAECALVPRVRLGSLSPLHLSLSCCVDDHRPCTAFRDLPNQRTAHTHRFLLMNFSASSLPVSLASYRPPQDLLNGHKAFSSYVNLPHESTARGAALWSRNAVGTRGDAIRPLNTFTAHRIAPRPSYSPHTRTHTQATSCPTLKFNPTPSRSIVNRFFTLFPPLFVHPPPRADFAPAYHFHHLHKLPRLHLSIQSDLERLFSRTRRRSAST